MSPGAPLNSPAECLLEHLPFARLVLRPEQSVIGPPCYPLASHRLTYCYAVMMMQPPFASVCGLLSTPDQLLPLLQEALGLSCGGQSRKDVSCVVYYNIMPRQPKCPELAYAHKNFLRHKRATAPAPAPAAAAAAVPSRAPHQLKSPYPQHSSWTILRRQLPLRLAYATTFNSCQGLTLDRAIVDLRDPVFAHGQLYGALTRFRERNHGQALFAPDNLFGKTVNVVSKELLL